jgi:hypothetical protein
MSARSAFGVIALLLGVLIGATGPAAATSIFSPGCAAVGSNVINLTPSQPSTPEFIGQFYAGDNISIRGYLGPFTYTVQQDPDRQSSSAMPVRSISPCKVFGDRNRHARLFRKPDL